MMRRKYYIAENYNRSFRTIVAARKEVMRQYKGFELRAVTIPIDDNVNTRVGSVRDPGTEPTWFTVTRRYDAASGKTKATIHEWVLNANGTLGKKLR